MVKYSESLDAVFGALSDPTRRGILEQLAAGRFRATDLAKPYDMGLSAVSKHLKVLETAGLIVRKRAGREHRFRVDPEPIIKARDWIGIYAAAWQHQFDRLDEYLKRTHPHNSSAMTSKEDRNGE